MNDYELDSVVNTMFVKDLTLSLETFLNTNKDMTHYESIIDSTTTDLTRQTIKTTLSSLYLGMHGYFFMNASELPALEIGNLEPTIKSMVTTLSLRYPQESHPAFMNRFPQELQLDSYITHLYNSTPNTFNLLRNITYKIPKKIGVSLILILIFSILAYGAIHRFDWIKTLTYSVLTGTIAALINLIIFVGLYWFSPQHPSYNFLQSMSFFGLRNDTDFIEYVSEAILSEGIRLCLIMLIIFVIGLIATEIKQRLYPKAFFVESHDEVRNQLILFTIILGIGITGNFFVLKPIPSLYTTYKESSVGLVSNTGQEPLTIIDALLYESH
jgi:hypothetical protein